jgi:hypothetical protein
VSAIQPIDRVESVIEHHKYLAVALQLQVSYPMKGFVQDNDRMIL